ncbi:MAG: ThuA domain-containing protein, partial [Cyclobacteriaceae bacterium]|nr:ThuA domain-containing protein [Cyclobacteriaceae bacterium]
MRKNILKYSLMLSILLFVMSCKKEVVNSEVLVFIKVNGYDHKSRFVGAEAIKKLGVEHGFTVQITEDAAYFTEDSLKNYSAVVFLNTTLDVLNHYQQADFERYIQAGGGFVGIHSAADTEYHWPWYNKLVGAYFKSHPQIQEAKITKEAIEFEGLQNIPTEWVRTDEWYNYREINEEIKVLLQMDETSYEGGENGDFHPITWFHEYDGGRAFYTGFGHTDESFSEPLMLELLMAGLNYAMGDKVLDYSKVKTPRVPGENRFTKTVLDFNLNEPTEMDVFEDGRIIFVERKGAIKLYDPNSNSVSTIANIPVYSGQEDGLMGIAIDPNYAENHWVYMYYSPVGEEAKQHLSRFVMQGNTIDFDSEKIMLVVPTQRDECCHTGGSIAFGPDGLLYLSTGDDTNPFDSEGFGPMDEREGRSAWDAQKSSSNTNDLRGKILRIRPLADGTYEIPEGNLFPQGTEGTRPEIFVMGCRNPYRISIDPKKGWLYWGDVGPDAGKDSDSRGQKGLDELNRAITAGFFGWPYFSGPNYAYVDYNFATGESGERYNPEAPINDSPNNTGLKDLPPSQKPLIWYGYDESKEFPILKTGGKNPMAGPIYYSDLYPDYEGKLPAYFDGKLFFYEWMRRYILLVSFDETGAISNIEPFMENTVFNNPIDMELGPDGRLYMLEYGTG